MRFDAKSRVKALVDTYSDQIEEYESQLLTELGEQGLLKLRNIAANYGMYDEQTLESIKKDYIAAQKYKDTMPMFFEDNYFYEFHDDQDFKLIIDSQLKKGMIDQTINVDDTIMNILRGATTDAYVDINGNVVAVKGTPLQSRQQDLLRFAKTYIQGGYNIYPLMRKINQQYASLVPQAGEPMTEDLMQQRKMCSRCQLLLEQMESSSPYASIFNTAEQLGSLIEKEKALIRKGDYDGAEALQDKIATYRMKLSTRLSSGEYDMEDLASVLEGKQNYIKEIEPGFNYKSSNYAMYIGLYEARKSVSSILKKTETQAQS